MNDREIIEVMVKGVLIQQQIERGMPEKQAEQEVVQLWADFNAGRRPSKQLGYQIKDIRLDAEAMLIELKKQGYKITR